MSVFPVILEYCGGEKTDALFKQIQSTNPDYEVAVLDNASPTNRCSVTTHQNKVNTNVGGGLLDCFNLASVKGFEYVMVFTNDISIRTVDIAELQNKMDSDKSIIQTSLALTRQSSQRHYPWMQKNRAGDFRRVHHSDIVASMMRVDFLKSIDFPKSTAGWGYDWQIGYEAMLSDKKIFISNNHVCHHPASLTEEQQKVKRMEMGRVYGRLYGGLRTLHSFVFAPKKDRHF